MAVPKSLVVLATEDVHIGSDDVQAPASCQSASGISVSQTRTELDRSLPSRNLDQGIPIMNTISDSEEKIVPAVLQNSSEIVDWDGPDDPEKAINWKSSKKWSNIAIISSIGFLTPLASSMIAPAMPLVMEGLEFHNDDISSFVVSIYILGYAIGPLVLAPLSEVYGRVPVYHVCNFLFVVWSMACALAPSVGALLAFRLFSGFAGSCPLTLGGGSIADMVVQEQRGTAMAFYTLGPLLGPVIGPIVGGYLGQGAGWRWIFWLITIAGGVGLGSGLLFLRESYEPVLLGRRTRHLQKRTAKHTLRSKFDQGITPRQYFIRAIVRPMKLLFALPVFLLSVYMVVVYGYLYLLFTTLTLVFEGEYHFSQGSVGPSYLGIGVGLITGILLFGTLSDWSVKRLAAQGEMKPEYRLPAMIPGSLFLPVGFFWYGWSAKAHIHWIMPIIGTSFIGFGILATFMSIQTYLIDAYHIHAASAIAANTVLRSLVGAFLPLAGPKMYAALGLGWGNSLLAFIALALAPLTWIFYKYGGQIREDPRFQAKL